MRNKQIILVGVIIFSLFNVAIVFCQDPAPQQSTSGPKPPPGVIAPKPLPVVPNMVSQTIAGVPCYYWRHGCGPTAVGMVVGYYDSHGYTDLIPGESTTETAAVDQAIASQGSGIRGSGIQLHYENYSLPMDSSSTIADSSVTYPTGCHTNDCIADYMHTSWSSDGNRYGWSWSNMVSPSFTSYVNLKNSSYGPSVQSYYMGSSLTWAVLTTEINNNRPMVFLVDSDGSGGTDHFVTIVGYNETTTQYYGCMDTWYAPVRWCQFRGMSASYQWGVWGGWSFRLAPLPVELSRFSAELF
jgi:hypothetical protein